jgi:hypothetical protein
MAEGGPHRICHTTKVVTRLTGSGLHAPIKSHIFIKSKYSVSRGGRHKMPRITYTASNFAGHWGPRLTGMHEIQISWPELIWAAVTIGKPGVSYLLAHGWHSASDIIVRSHTVYANLRQVPSRHIEKSSLYVALDPTEKGATSYFIGMMAAKIVAARLLDTPWLFHLSMFHTLGGHTTLLGKSQPDLVGLNRTRGWVVVEAKGRTNGHSASAALAAKAQTRQLRQINGVSPILRVAVLNRPGFRGGYWI